MRPLLVGSLAYSPLCYDSWPFKTRVFFLAAIALLRLALCPDHSSGAVEVSEKLQHAQVNRQADFTQADMMLKLLRSSRSGNIDPLMMESVLNAHGTALIIDQQNISRRVTKEQYEIVILFLSRGELPDIAPVDATERSRRGVDGLRNDVWPALLWGRANTNLLAQRIEQIKRLDLSRNSLELASRFLPEPVELSPRLYIVMGGRAGAASLEGDEIYFDVLATSYRTANGTSRYPTAIQIGEYFAHEIHHLGLSQIIDRTRSRLRLSNPEQRAFSFLMALVMEGSASYLINGHCSLEVMRRDTAIGEALNKSKELLKLSEQVLKSVLADNLEGEDYERATTPFLGSGWHSAGATMLSVIYEAGRLQAVMKVLRDPRRLLNTYNWAASKLKPDARRPVFNAGLAKKVSAMGS